MGFGGSGVSSGSVFCAYPVCHDGDFYCNPFSQTASGKRILCGVKEDMKERIWFLRKKRPVFICICFMIAGLNLFLSSMITIGIPVIIVERFSMADQLLGVTQGLLAVGGMIGGLFTVVFAKILRPGKAWVFLLLCAFSACVKGAGMLLAEQLRFLKYLILSGTGLLVMIFSTMFSIQMLAVVHIQTPAELTGKVVACIMAFIMCAQPAGQLLYGLLFEKIFVETPFIMMVTGLFRPTEGEITFLGTSVFGQDKGYLKEMGILIETPVFHEHLSAKENLELHLCYMGCGVDGIEETLHQVGLQNTGRQPVSKFDEAAAGDCQGHQPFAKVVGIG